MKHTKGPWELETSSGYTDIVSLENATQKVCMMAGEDLPLEELEANAHLIAAAPELLAACKWALSLIETTIDYPIKTRVLQDAINKAEEGA